MLASDVRHATVDRALRLLGLGAEAVVPVASGPDARLRVDALAETLAAASGPTIVLAQVGEVNTGAVDPVDEICDLAHAAGAWVHVDGAFGLWAAASPTLRSLVTGVERADSWATDFHKWLNVPYDSGFAACAHPQRHRAAMGTTAAYLEQAAPDGPRDQMDWNPEFSRRARGFAVYAALRSLGRRGVADLVDRCCAHARRFAERLDAIDGVEVLNDVVLDQVLVGFAARPDDGGPGGSTDDLAPRRRGGAGLGRVLDERYDMGRAAGDEDLRRQLADDRGRRRPVGACHPGRARGCQAMTVPALRPGRTDATPAPTDRPVIG